MRQTLFLIPHEIAGWPVFGVGWLLIALLVGIAARLAWAAKRGQPLGELVATEGLMWGIVAAVVVFLLPAVELKNVAGEPVGMAIRGYGVMLLCGVTAAIGLAAVRTKNRGIDPEVIYSLAPWVFIGGIVGARMFYVIQYREKFIGDSLGETIRNIVAFTEGGLVVYGSIIGGLIAGLIFVSRNRLPVWKLGDAIVPCIFLGIFLGRIGCLLNGCCYGGRCEPGWTAAEFPPGTEVYEKQLASGELLGMKVDPLTSDIQQVSPGSVAQQAGISEGSRLDRIVPDQLSTATAPRDIPADQVRRGITVVVDGKPYHFSPQQLPQRALPVQAVQVLSSVSALLLCCVLCAASYLVRRDGAVMLLGFVGYAIVRFILEWVRVDEGGQFGTNLSISQWVSIGVLIFASTGLVLLYRGAERRPRA